MTKNLKNVSSHHQKFRKTPHSIYNQIGRQIWAIVYILLFKPSPRFLHGWRRLLLRLFGAKIGPNVKLYPTIRVWAPWNLELGEHCSLGDAVQCYNAAKIQVAPFATISQNATLCTASHDTTQLHLPLVTADIKVGAHAWICAEVFVMPGVDIGEGAVIGVRSTVFSSIPAWMIAFGTPCRVTRERYLQPQPAEQGVSSIPRRIN